MARRLNYNISIVVMQMWSNETTIDQLQTGTDIETYATSVVKFIIDHNIDGYDNDYEGGNMCPQAGKVFSAIRQKLDKVHPTPPYHVSIAPSNTAYLNNDIVKSSLTHVNMQNYSGGRMESLQADIDTYKQIFNSSTNVNIIFGVDSEIASENWPEVAKPSSTTTSNVFDTLYDIVTTNGLNGIYNWRLDSGDWIFQNAFQVYLYNKFHDTSLQCPFTLEQVVETWPNVKGGPIAPFK